MQEKAKSGRSRSPTPATGTATDDDDDDDEDNSLPNEDALLMLDRATTNWPGKAGC